MDIDDFFHRSPIQDQSLSLVARLESADQLPPFLAKAFDLLGPRQQPDELVVVLPQWPQTPQPARYKGIRVRLIINSKINSGKVLVSAIAASRSPIIVTVDPHLTLDETTLKEILARLDGADAVIGCRRNRAGLIRRSVEWLARLVFGVPVADPLCPIKVFRRESVSRIHLQTDGLLVEFELIAKLTFLVALIDEQPLPQNDESIVSVLWSERARLGELFLTPSFCLQLNEFREPAVLPYNNGKFPLQFSVRRRAFHQQQEAWRPLARTWPLERKLGR